MGRKMIGIGSRTSTGGQVLQGNTGISIDSAVDTSSIGHIASCPVCSKKQGPIVAVGPRTVTLPAGPIALEGDYVACGCPPGANTLIATQSSVYGGAEHSGASISSVAPLLAAPKIIQSIFLSHGPEKTLVDSYSRFYVDLNIHVKTTGYLPGERVSVTVSGPVEQTLSGVVAADGVANIMSAFDGVAFDMEGEW
ncbi:PAAR domain-containing protein [Pseudomonas sp. NFIX28]|uniref:PAAR domain-containing protein n=1 Tax=Pseudomonas sp. NFIX28 TaxID=1566235 RepID=UPI00089697AA|nr:PAAR domain-containing protein [Pseudomonas sp. NFIX28]SDZ68482.1 Zn-binding Pro-Ala-Ala-Arg (PAAR) domain-containing protein, incolved in TypeVI secretion [Pseudomonas sp. NFIX28]